MFSKSFASFTLLALSFYLGVGVLRAQKTPGGGGELKYVVIVSRHGVRPPLWTDEQLNRYAIQPWPKWDVPPGHLTAHGAALLKLFGAYDRAQFAKAGLLSAKGCNDADKVYIWADTDERTIATGRALSEGMLPDCGLKVNSLAEGEPDPIFSPLAAGIGHADRGLGTASVIGRIGGHPDALLDVHRPAIETLEEILLGCKSGAESPQAGRISQLSVLTIPASVGPAKGDKLAEMKGPIATASTLAENFLLEYANGMTGGDLGWGRLDEAKLRQIMSVHTAYENLLRRDPYIGRASASNMLSHILKSMEQAIAGRAVAGAMGKPGDRVLVLAGHDGNVSNIAGTLDLSWLLPGYQPNDTPPGGALFFELWRQPNGEYQVRSYYTAQTMEQMHNAMPLTQDNPPAVAPLFLQGCSEAGPGMPCSWTTFQHKVEAAIDPSMVKL
jgi:4-phytase / acid phosphatase